MTVAPLSPPAAIIDPEMPQLALALNRESARKEFKRRLPRVSGAGRLRLKDIRLIRHKPGRRCVVEYDVEVERPDTPRELITLIGKTRVRRSGNEAFRLQQLIWDANFNSDTPDGVSVPEPLGVISAFQMWFQRKVPGRTAELLLDGGSGLQLSRRIVQAIDKLHRAGIPAPRAHTISEELRILKICFEKVAGNQPKWGERLQRLFAVCEQKASAASPAGCCGIHRDFYAAQVIIDRERLWLLDFDLYCQGDPALDVGNFIGHVTEQSLREHGSSEALRPVETVLEEEFVRIRGEQARPALRLYRDLTIARHVFLSTQFPDRHHLTERLLNLSEQRFA